MQRIAVTDTLAQLANEANEWDGLLSQSASDSIFLTWEWLYTWCEHFLHDSRKLFILSLYEDEKLIAIAPWCIRTIGNLPHLRQIEFLGAPDMGSDYLDVFALKGKEKEAAAGIYGFLFGEAKRSWNSIALTDMRAESRFLLHFTQQLKGKGKYFAFGESAYCPLVRLPASWPDYIDSLSPHRKQLFGRQLRALRKNPSTRHETVPVVRSDDGLARFTALYGSVGAAQGETFYADLARFVGRCDKPWIEADFLNVEGKDVAGLLHFRYRNALFLYSMAVDREFTNRVSLGNVLVGLCIERAISEGLQAYDFLKGPHDFKFHWTGTGNRTLGLSLCRKQVYAVGALLCRMVKDLGKAVLR